MLCSARELKLSDEHAGLLILDESAPVGEDVRKHLDLDDTIFTLKLTPNLAHGLSVYGIARELSALTGAPLKKPAIAPVLPAFDDKLRNVVPPGKKALMLCRSGVRSIAAAKRASELGMEAYNVLEGFEGDPDEHAQRGRKGGWRLHGLPWRQH